MFIPNLTKKIAYIFIGGSFILFSIWLTSYMSWKIGIEHLAEKNQQQIQQFISHLKSKLERFQSLPQLIAKNPQLIEALQQKHSSARIDLINHFLADVNATIGASDTYLMDATGLTIAASNWEDSRPFVGKNFSFRPYFNDAMEGKMGRYFALGTTSGKRGYYFSYPVIYAAEVIGVVAVKMNLSNIEQFWSNRATQFAVLDTMGIIFISTQQDWLYHSINPLSKQQRDQVLRSQRYSNHSISTLAFKNTSVIDQSMQLFVIGKRNKPSKEYLVQKQFMPLAKWSVMILASTDEVKIRQKYALLFLFLFYSIAVLAIYLTWQKIKRRQEKEQLQHQYQQRLEREVKAQTADLNQEIVEHKKTELMLKTTQDELIQTAKLAVLGQMSASISHELNNPLAALRSYAENAQKFLDLEKYQQTKDNLLRIESLTERMAAISSQLKLFARKSTGTLETIKLQSVLEAALEIIQPQLKSLTVQITMEQTDASVLANRIQLEQVFVNILSNAIDSVKQQKQGHIDIKVTQNDDLTSIHFIDNGAGIENQNIDSLFEPFFTTKRTGMGLGLSISKRIIENFNGSLNAKNLADTGAQFTIQLKTVVP